MTISIAMATYNGEKFIREQLDSVLAQSFPDFELVICDDCSSDTTAKIIKSYQEKDNRIILHQNDTNIGFLKNFEKAISLCKGDFIACCDQDDIWTTDHLQILINNIGDNDCIGANAIIIDENSISTNRTLAQALEIDLYPSSDSIFFRECYFNFIQGSALLFKKKITPFILPFPQGIQFHDHWIALNACIQNGCKYIPDIILKYRSHSTNVTGIKENSKTKIFYLSSYEKERIFTTYKSNLAILQSLPLHSEHKNITDAIKFFKDLLENKNRLKTVLFFVKNYESITFTSKKRWKLFLYRILRLFLTRSI